MTSDTDRLIAEVTAQQQRLVLDHFDNDDAWALGCLIVELGRERGLPITVDVRRHGHQLFHAALPGTVPDNDRWIERKVRAVDRFGKPSYVLSLLATAAGRPFEEMAAVSALEYAAAGGCFPVTVRGVGPVGTVTVSGLSERLDHELVVEALEQVCDQGSAAR
ncbi:heme-degrading domain-containing protein [Actinotalea sp.]|uniref:heme-degrading domain-containing protein n=1 Tax=Actinotalea sp. TaxID=1872145 RepID=UPI002B668731|nr:heme-degrading domain-containing protein [Actinotalea sp.]HQY32647.1 heme-degrading domain-containing protein [Actinotalea sp.]HRA49892.1 heme-degrading domain-containing protein [Actinotalea sp.]